ncbi:MAG TPA: hypothetical protein VIJ75_23735 [Hanamia sp.]
MKASSINGFSGGCMGAFILIIVMYILMAAGMGDPAFVKMYHSTFGIHSPAFDQVIAGILFIISGGIWGMIFTWMVKNPTIGKGMLFGFLPTLWLLIAVNAFMGQPLFNGFHAKGIIMPVIFNVVIWGSFVGWYASRKLKTSTV